MQFDNATTFAETLRLIVRRVAVDTAHLESVKNGDRSTITDTDAILHNPVGIVMEIYNAGPNETVLDGVVDVAKTRLGIQHLERQLEKARNELNRLEGRPYKATR